MPLIVVEVNVSSPILDTELALAAFQPTPSFLKKDIVEPRIFP